MKKIGLITYHNPCNYGATLQTWATVKYFENRGFKVCVIDDRQHFFFLHSQKIAVHQKT